MFCYGKNTKEISDFLKKHYGFTLRKSELATGSFSTVFSLSKNRVLKLSIDPYWYLLMKYLQNKNCQHVPSILKDHGVGVLGYIQYKSYNISDSDFYSDNYDFDDDVGCYKLLKTPVYAVEMPMYHFPESDSKNCKLQESLY